MPRLFLVRHGRPAIAVDAPSGTWGLDLAGFPDIDALAASGRLPEHASWFSSPEPKAVETGRRLTSTPVKVVQPLAEQERGVRWFHDAEEFAATVRRAFDRPQERAVPEWEPLARTRERVVPAVRRILADQEEDEVVLVGHGTALTLLVSELTGRQPDLEAWAALEMPDVWVISRPP